MKISFTIILLLLSLIGTAQTSDSIILPHYSEIVKVDSAKKEQLYNAAKDYLALNFKSSKAVIQLDDKDQGKIIGKFTVPYSAEPFSVGTLFSGYFIYTLQIEVKDGKYRFEITDISHESTKDGFSLGTLYGERPKGMVTKNGWRKVQTAANDGAQSTIDDMKLQMVKLIKKNQSNW